MSIAIDKRIIPLTGLPRSGSTVLASILNQNNDFTVSLDSDLPEISVAVRNWAAVQIRRSQLPHEIFQESVLNFCRSGAKSWVDNNCPTTTLIDKSRYWIYQHQFLFQVFPNIKMILIVRDLRYVINSLIKSESNNFCLNFQEHYDDMKEDFMLQRIEKLFKSWWLKESIVGIKELIEIAPSYRKQILVFRYEDLILNSHDSMNRIYDFFELTRYNHDFNSIEQIKPHYDNLYLPYGNHQIKSKLEADLSKSCSHLSTQHSNWIIEEYKWFFEFFYPEVLQQ